MVEQCVFVSIPRFSLATLVAHANILNSVLCMNHMIVNADSAAEGLETHEPLFDLAPNPLAIEEIFQLVWFDFLIEAIAVSRAPEIYLELANLRVLSAEILFL